MPPCRPLKAEAVSARPAPPGPPERMICGSPSPNDRPGDEPIQSRSPLARIIEQISEGGPRLRCSEQREDAAGSVISTCSGKV